jgi:hypothetical protein
MAEVLGLTPLSAKRVYPQRRPGRPVGAVSAPDRVALPNVQWRDGMPPKLRVASPAALNRARGHPVDD